MKTWSLILAILFLISCKKDKENVLQPTGTNQTIIDSILFDVHITTINGNVVKMEKFLENVLVESVTIDYEDTVVTKQYHRNDSLISKRVYFLNNDHYAKYSLDSFYNYNAFFKTTYSYDASHNLTKEHFEPAVYFSSVDGSENIEFYDYTDSSAYTEYGYTTYEGNTKRSYWLLISPNVISTGYYKYKFSTIPMKYDLLNFNNTLLGNMSANLPSSYGYENEARPVTYYERVKFQYELVDDKVTKRTDYFMKNDSILYKNVLNYIYH